MGLSTASPGSASTPVSPERGDTNTPYTLAHVDALRRRHGEALDMYFDAAYYASSYPDLAAFKQDLLLHFCNHGFREGRNPSALVSNAYCRWLARRHDTVIESASDLFAFAEEVSTEDCFGTHVLISPRWIALQIVAEPARVMTLAQLMRMAAGDTPLSLHPALPPMHLPPATSLAGAIALLDPVAVAASSLLDLTDYARRHNDLAGLAAHPLKVFEQAWTEGLFENRMKYLGTSAPRWATASDLFQSAATLFLRAAAAPLLVTPLTQINRLPREGLQRLALVERDWNDFQNFDFATSPEFPSAVLLLQMNAVAAAGKLALVSQTFAPTASTAPREITDRMLFTGSEVTPQRVVYSVCIGGYDGLPRPPSLDDCAYYLITDSPTHIVPPEWTVVRPTLSERDTKRLCLWYKTHPHRLFPRARYVTWIDANIDCRAGSGQVLAAHESLSEIATFQHPDRTCVYDEAKKIIDLKLDDKTVVEAAMERMRKAGMPENSGAFETNVLFSQCGDPAVREFFDRWWKEIFLGSRRDQVSFTYAAWATMVHVTPLDGDRSAKDSRFFAKRPHQTKAGRYAQ